MNNDDSAIDPSRPNSSSVHSVHVPVMPAEVIEALQPRDGMVIVDGTFGGGGHARLLAEAVAPSGRVIALDRDADAVQRSATTIGNLPISEYCCSYHQADRALEAESLGEVDGFLLDLGLSSDQLADRSRGFSFESEGPLDLRFDPSRGESAAELLMRVGEKDLADLIYQLGEERFSRRIARRIVERRRLEEPIETAKALAELVRRCVPRSKVHSIDPATRTFQALRIAVNDELTILRQALAAFPSFLRPGGRIAVISFHSLEDRIVKHAFREDERLRVVTRKPLRPSEHEIRVNPRARSAKLRVAERC